MAYVYLLNDYEEHGPENMVATLDRAALPGLLAENWGADLGPKYYGDAGAALEGWLLRTDADLASKAPIDLETAWGGIQLSVIELP